MQKEITSGIDLVKTGELLKQKIKVAGYSVKEIQNMLGLSCPQPIYRWFKGQILPTVEHLHRLSKILNVHMEELLATKGTEWIDSSTELLPFERRMLAYWKHMTAA